MRLLKHVQLNPKKVLKVLLFCIQTMFHTNNFSSAQMYMHHDVGIIEIERGQWAVFLH